MKCPCCDFHVINHLDPPWAKGVLPPVACGSFVGAWTHFVRWCWNKRTPDLAAGTTTADYTEGFNAGVLHARKEMRP